MPRKVTTTDDTLQIYQDRDLGSNVVVRVPKGTDIQIGAVTFHEGREWMEATLGDRSAGYVLGPSARGHTTLMPTAATKTHTLREGAMDRLPLSFSSYEPAPSLRKLGGLIFLVITVVAAAAVGWRLGAFSGGSFFEFFRILTFGDRSP